MADRLDRVKKDVKIAWWQTWLLVSRVISLAVLLGAHWGLDRAIKLLMPDFPNWVSFLEIVFVGCFSIAYVHVAWDIVSVFAPIWRRAPKVISERLNS